MTTETTCQEKLWHGLAKHLCKEILRERGKRLRQYFNFMSQFREGRAYNDGEGQQA